MRDAAILLAVVVELLTFLLILGIGILEGYKDGRVTRSAVFLTWIQLPVHAMVFTIVGDSLLGPFGDHRRNWFPEGIHSMAHAISGWMTGMMLCGLGIAIRRVVRGEPLFNRPQKQ